MKRRTRALPRIMRSRTSPSSIRRAFCVAERARRSSPGRANACNHPAGIDHARATRPVTSNPSASKTLSTKATGRTQTSASAEYDLQSRRTRARVSARSSAGVRSRVLARFEHRRASFANTRRGRDDHASAGEPGPPAEIDVVGPGGGRRVEAAELVEEVGAYEHRRVRHVEDVAHAVVLLLIDLVGLDAGEGNAVVVDRHPDLEEDPGIVAVDDLGPDDARVRTVCLLDQQTRRVGVEADVVVAKEQEHRALDGGQRLVRRGRESALAGAPANERAGKGLGNAIGRVLGRAVVENQDRQSRIVLGPRARPGSLPTRVRGRG